FVQRRPGARDSVARRARAWIETPLDLDFLTSRLVARRARAWIETPRSQADKTGAPSPAARGRGLKQVLALCNEQLCWSPAARGRGLKRQWRGESQRGHCRPPRA